MTECLLCGKQLVGHVIDSLFCTKYHRREYLRRIVDDIHELSDSELGKLRKIVLDGKLLSVMILTADKDLEEWKKEMEEEGELK